MLPPVEDTAAGREVPLNCPSKGEEVVAPSYTFTKSYPLSVANELNVSVTLAAPEGWISFWHDMLLL